MFFLTKKQHAVFFGICAKVNVFAALRFFVFSYFALNNTRIKKFELDIEYDYDFLLYGIVSAEKTYRLAWQMNHIYPYNFERSEDYDIMLGNKSCSFHQFSFMHEENHTAYSLMANKDDGSWLLPELRNFDFLLVINGALDFFDEVKLRADMDKITSIQLTYPVDITTLKSRQNLIYLH